MDGSTPPSLKFPPHTPNTVTGTVIKSLTVNKNGNDQPGSLKHKVTFKSRWDIVLRKLLDIFNHLSILDEIRIRFSIFSSLFNICTGMKLSEKTNYSFKA